MQKLTNTHNNYRSIKILMQTLSIIIKLLACAIKKKNYYYYYYIFNWQKLIISLCSYNYNNYRA